MNKDNKRSRIRFDYLRSLIEPWQNDYTLLDEEADEWLGRLNVPTKYKRQNIKTRDNEKPEGAFKNNGRKRK
tara:strand:+ start:395 stop:610 length:216 start_codon:yes stop_codon:yes gene_type:complete